MLNLTDPISFTFFEISIGFHILIPFLPEMFSSLKLPVTQFHGFPLIFCITLSVSVVSSIFWTLIQITVSASVQGTMFSLYLFSRGNTGFL